MKLCITATGKDISSPVDPAFGRAAWFVLVDTDSGKTETIANTSINASHGAGIAAAQIMGDNNVDAVLTGKLGPKAQVALRAAGIRMYEGVGQYTVNEALDNFRSGKYNASGPAARIPSDTAAAPSPAAQSMGQAAGFGFTPNAHNMGNKKNGKCKNRTGAGKGQGRGGRR